MTQTRKRQLHESLTVAYNSYAQSLKRYAYTKVSNPLVSEDLVQDTFIKIWDYLVKGGKVHMMKAFLYHVLNNLIIDHYRKHKTVSLEALVEENGFDPGYDESEHIINSLDGKRASSLVKRLPEAYKNVMRMRYEQDLSLKEMSLATGETANTLAVHIHRGLKKLRDLYNIEQHSLE